MPELRSVDLPHDHDIATPEAYREAIRRVGWDRRMTRDKTDKVLSVLRAWIALPEHCGTTRQIGAPNQMSPAQVQSILTAFGALVAEKLAEVSGYSHGVHPSGDALAWSTTGFASKGLGEKDPATWTMRRNFVAGLRLLNGWLPKEVVDGDRA